MSDYVDSPIELTTCMQIEKVRKVVNKSLKTFGGFRYRPDQNANDFRCEVASGEHSGATVVVQIQDDGTERLIRMVVTDAFISRRLVTKHRYGVVKANAAIDLIVKKVRKDDPSASVRAA